MKAIIIEDELPARMLLKRYLEKHPEIELIGEYDNGFEGLKAIKTLAPNLVFLDINMPKITGIEMLEVLEKKPAVIFTTAYQEYALKAFELNATDYLLKPFSQERFDEALVKIGFKNISAQKEEKTSSQLEHITVKTKDKIVLIEVADVFSIEAEDDYVTIKTAGSKYLKKQTMSYFEKQLPSMFLRVHRSTIVNLKKVKNIEKYGKENYCIVLENSSEYKISKSRYATLKQELNL